MDESVRKMVDGAIEIESALEGKVVGAPDLIMLARLAGPLAREVLELDEKLRVAEAKIAELNGELYSIPFESRAVAEFYKDGVNVPFWNCLTCGCEWPRNVVTACANCHKPTVCDETDDD